jgi:hypothetical protein
MFQRVLTGEHAYLNRGALGITSRHAVLEKWRRWNAIERGDKPFPGEWPNATPRRLLHCRRMDKIRDFNDGKIWPEKDIATSRALIAPGDTIEKAARYLCRATTVDEVEAKARELGLPARHG